MVLPTSIVSFMGYNNKCFLVSIGMETIQAFAATAILASSQERRALPYILLFQ